MLSITEQRKELEQQMKNCRTPYYRTEGIHQERKS